MIIEGGYSIYYLQGFYVGEKGLILTGEGMMLINDDDYDVEYYLEEILVFDYFHHYH